MSAGTGPDRPADHGDDGAVVRRMLAGHARSHVPRTNLIEARLAESQRAWMLGAEPDGPARSPLPSRQVTAGLLAASAAVLAVLAVSSVARGPGDNTIAGEPDGRPSDAPASWSVPPPPGSTGSVTTTDAGSGTSAGSPASGPEPSSTAGFSPGPSPPSVSIPAGTEADTTVSATRPVAGASSVPSTAAASSTDPAGSSINVEDLPDRLELSADGYLDWVITGARSDGKIVRLKSGPAAITVAGPATAPRSVAGPLEVSWSDGVPEQSRDGNRSWWSAPAQPTVFTVTVAGRAEASELALYAGGSVPVQVTVTIEGLGSRLVDLPADGSGSAGTVVVALDDSARGRDVTFVVGTAAPTGTVAVGQVTAR